MTQENIAKRNDLMQRLQSGEPLTEEERMWLQDHPFYSSRYGKPYIIADLLAVDPGKEVILTVQCLHHDDDHPIVPTFTIPFEKGGYVKLSNVVNSPQDYSKMKKSSKFSMRMLSGITATLQCRSESGIIMVSYQGWVPDNKPFPLWYESVRCPRFAMMKKVINDNMIEYGCCGANSISDQTMDPLHFQRFRFAVNRYYL